MLQGALSLSQSVSRICVYVHVRLSLHVCPGAHAYECVDDQAHLQALCPRSHSFYVLRWDRSGVWNPPSRLAWLAIKPQGSTGLYLPVLGL